MKIVVLGAGVQGTVFAVRLALAGHQVTLVSRAARAAELRHTGATIQDAETSRICTKALPVLDTLPPDFAADICLVTVRREQIKTIVPGLAEAIAIPRVVFLGNYAYSSDNLLAILGRSRTVLAFPGIAGYSDGAKIRYVDIPQQHTVVEDRAHDVVSLFRGAGFRVDHVRAMDAWLQRHAVFITAITGALYENDCDARLLAQNAEAVRRLIVGVREGWAAQDRKGVGAAPLALQTIMRWFLCDCQQYIGAGSSPLLVETSTLRDTPGMLRLKWLRSEMTFEVASARTRPQDSKGCLRRLTPGGRNSSNDSLPGSHFSALKGPMR